MITENRVRELLELFPTNSWLRRYIIYASKQTTSPAPYHIACGLGCLSALAPSNIGIQFGAWPVRANFYSVLVGRSGDDQKSTATHIARKIINEANSLLVQANPVSPEGLQESLGDQARQTLVYSEFGLFLTQTKQGYGEGLKTLITDLWDCTPQSRRKAKKDENIMVKDPRLSIISACAMPFLSEHTTSEDWTGGFLSRWFFIHAHRERVDSFPMRAKQNNASTILSNELRNHASTAHYFCNGLDDDAFKMWDDWFLSINNRSLPKIISGLKSRIPTHCLRIILLLAFDLGYTKTFNWIIDTKLVSLAIEITEMYVESLFSISESLEPDDESRTRKKILTYLKDEGGIGSLGDFVRHYRCNIPITRSAIEWLTIAGYIQKFTHSSNTKGEGEREDIILKLIKRD